MYRIRDWDKHFENAGSRKIESTKWIPIPNKRGFGYVSLIKQKTGEAMYGCWCAIVGLASTCEVRGELRSGSHWFNAANIADLIGFSHKTIVDTLEYCSKSLDWIEDMTATTLLPLDYQPSTTLLDGNTSISVPCNVLSCSVIPEKGSGEKPKTWRTDCDTYLVECKAASVALHDDDAYIADREQYHPGLDIKLSIKKAFSDYWGTPAGWKKKKASRSTNLDWRATYNTALTMKINQVWKPREQINGAQYERI